MKKVLAVFLAMTMICGCTKKENNKEETKAFYSDAINAYVEAIDMKYAYDLTLQLATDPSMHENELGFRTAGSDAEHKAADFIAEQMEKIGLVEVEKVPVTVDKWQFNGASLKIADTDLELSPVSYMVSGTDENGITAEIVDCGTGFAEDYEDKDVEGKIVLVGVDQWNESWINGYIYEAYEHGAVAVVSYDVDGYGRNSADDHQIQDVCCEDVMPTVIITANEGEALVKAIEEGHYQCTLVVDSVMLPNEGISYDVVGKIPGKSHDQQMIFAGHYDMYFTGFQDDCSAIATAISMAKAMIESGYEPENDILVVAHGAEEWGATGTEFDWTRGAWEMINTVHPEWASKTLALFNYELCAFDDGTDTFAVSCVPEYASFVADAIDQGDLQAAVKDYGNGIQKETFDTTTMEDGVSYRGAGVPYFINVTDTCAGTTGDGDGYSWTQLNYHTESDNETTYCEKVMKGNIGVFGSLAILIDQNPAMPLDLTATTDDLTETFDIDIYDEAGDQRDAWNENIKALEEAMKAFQEKGKEINERYAKAKAENANDEELAKIRQEGVEYNQKMLEAFKFIQDHFVGIEFSSDIVVKHQGYLDNIYILDGILDALMKGEIANDEDGALDLAYNLNALCEYNYYIFSPEAARKVGAHADNSNDSFKWWGQDKGYKFTDTWEATVSLFEKVEEENPDVRDEIEVYQTARDEQLDLYVEIVDQEIDAMEQLTSLLG